MHVGDMSKGMVPGIAIVGGGIPLATGMALAFKLQKSDLIVACFFGDGAVAEGAFHEAVNMAAIWALPVVFVCENNLYGASTRLDLVMKNPRVADRASSYGFAGETVDGNDVEAVYAGAKTAAARCREGGGPVLLELLTYRQTGHSRRDARAYQPEAERKAWAARDPIEIFAARLEREGVIDEAGVERMRAQAAKRFAEAVERARAAPQPSLDDLESDVFAPERQL
jgi:pyruvate dehydrogenase E1 component alpha subunit